MVDEAPEGSQLMICRLSLRSSLPTTRPKRSTEITEKLRVKAGLSKNPTGEVANGRRPASKPRAAARKKTPAKR